MTIIRISKDKNHPYIMVDRQSIQNPEMSLRARGLLVFLLSFPDGWDFRRKDLISRLHKDGRDSVDSALRELEATGHVVRHQPKMEDGTFGQMIMEVHEVCLNNRHDQPCTDIPQTGNPFTVKSEENCGVHPRTGKPYTENPFTVLNNNSINNKNACKTRACAREDTQAVFQRSEKEIADSIGKTHNRYSDKLAEHPVEGTEEEEKHFTNNQNKNNTSQTRSEWYGLTGHAMSMDTPLTPEYLKKAVERNIPEKYVEEVHDLFKSFYSIRKIKKNTLQWLAKWEEWCDNQNPFWLSKKDKPVEENKALSADIDREDSPEIKIIREKILHAVGEASYTSWFKCCRVVSTTNGIELIAPNSFIRDHLSSVYSKEIIPLFEKEVFYKISNALSGNQIKPVEGDNYVSATQVPKSDLIGLESALC